MQPINNTTYCLVTATSKDSITDKWFSYTSKLVSPSEVEDLIDAYHVKQLEKNCSLEAVRVTSSSDPRFIDLWDVLVKDKTIPFKTKFHILKSELPDLSVEVKFQSPAFNERRRNQQILNAQRMSEARSLREATNVAD